MPTHTYCLMFLGCRRRPNCNPRHVILPKDLAKTLPKSRLLTETEVCCCCCCCFGLLMKRSIELDCVRVRLQCIHIYIYIYIYGYICDISHATVSTRYFCFVFPVSNCNKSKLYLPLSSGEVLVSNNPEDGNITQFIGTLCVANQECIVLSSSLLLSIL
jgi:hypothetical protein